MHRFVLASVLALCVVPVRAGVNWIKIDPFVIRTNRVAPIAFRVTITPAAAKGRIDLVTGAVVALATTDGGTTWTASLTPAQVLAGYAPDDVNRNHFGMLKFFDAAGNSMDGSRQLHIAVLDAADDTAPLTFVANMRVNNNVANIQQSSLANPTGNEAVQTITKQFYGLFSDAYDFLNVVYAVPEYPANRDHFRTRNDVQGIGSPIFNIDALHGSAGKLIGVTRYPLASIFDMGEPGSLHEIGHQWINYLAHPTVKANVPHWPISQMAHHLMGQSLPPTMQGGQYPWKYVKQADGTFKFQAEPARDDFNDVDLYLMGLLDASAVVPQLVLSNPTQNHCSGCTISGSLIPFGAAEIVAQHGARVPNAANSQKSFRVGTIVVTRDRALTFDEMQWFAKFAARASATQPQQWSVGLAKGMSKPFAMATRGLATLGSSLASNAVYPLIRDIQPRSGPAGTQVVITGSGFNSPLIVIGTDKATIKAQSSTSITVVVPAGASGKFDVNLRQTSGLAVWPAGFARQ